MNVFDIIGPIMIGPSSSHTAGAARIGKVARSILGCDVKHAEIGLAGSFAKTGRGHGTDRAIVAGLLGMKPDDPRLPSSFDVAKEAGLEFSFSEISLPRAHPNTARLHISGTGGECVVQGASVGGGNILIQSINGMETEFTGGADTLIIAHQDTPGVIAEVTSLMAWHGANIGNFKLNRPQRGFNAIMTVEVDGKMAEGLPESLRALPHVTSVVYIKAGNA